MRRWLPSPTRRIHRRRRQHPQPTLPEAQLRAAWQVLSLLLDYPTETLVAQLPLVREALTGFPTWVRTPLAGLCDHLERTPLRSLQGDYVATFDTTRKRALHLTYYVHGDTRKRGIALVQFKQAFRRGGLEVNDRELPDHLCVVLQFGATADVGTSWRLLNDHRVSVELLQRGLDEWQSPWAGAVRALRATLPELDGDQREAVAALLAQGPPNEHVGFDAYSLDPLLNPHPDSDPDAAPTLDRQGALR
ncbi:nitrate reductase molybdenum cofactor assembly chaperone [uncultured Tessaracoccus sp.]|uniref:nitrate reductase molybdenum cofactor assembly chaperone n=1 Tax=uncultured Tessaracoccus sp. TaxID=905023 RepID=UPI0025F5DA13|nr:nitrate reductase molybdenum cofactor assembly chaperone [uncultured Tessaracoccus sp.]